MKADLPLRTTGCPALTEQPRCKTRGLHAAETRGGIAGCLLALQFEFQSEQTVNIHRKEDEKGLEKGARGRVPRTSQQVLSCALAGERKVHSLSMAVLLHRILQDDLDACYP